MPAPRKRRPRRRYDIKGAEIIRGGHVARLTSNREYAANLTRARHYKHHGGGGGGGGGSAAGGGGGGGDEELGRRLREAAQVIADQAKHNASWSSQIPPSIKVSGGAGGVVIATGARPAYPNEVEGVKHPVFGGTGTARPRAPWVRNKHRPFLAPAADTAGDAAAEKFAQVIDDWARERGFR